MDTVIIPLGVVAASAQRTSLAIPSLCTPSLSQWYVPPSTSRTMRGRHAWPRRQQHQLTFDQQLAWIIAFIGSVVAVADKSKEDSNVPNYTWWTLSYNLVMVICITLMVGTDTEMDFSVAVCLTLSAKECLVSNIV